ncbi:MAG: UDP-N-acetylmuramoyl-L-alanyl-D-glutamate--2,6-diaminopimelate ligase [Polaromonas sp.]|nr:UDP-N-acetylmuramoyl-L-alanyl-D-glutamate--2,6-diaminopimelate ligase [Polaromonas sp.]
MITNLHTPQQAANWLQAQVHGSLTTDSRQVKAGDGFIAWPGAAADARQYVGDVLKAGAGACLVERDGVDAYGFADLKIAAYANLKAAAAPIAAAYYGDPSKQLQTVAITGTNGKTSTAWWLALALNKLDRKCGVIGTLGIGMPGAMIVNGLTTPDPVLLQQQLRRFVDEGFSACAIEASSIGIAEKRLDATQLQVAIFTNFTQDHLDYHGSMQAYWAAKESLFMWPDLQSAVINVDDAKGRALSLMLKGASIDVWTVAIDEPARLQAKAIEQRFGTLSFVVAEGAERRVVSTSAIGLYNVSNLLGVVGALRALGLSLEDAAKACSDLPAVPGRLNTLSQAGKPLVVIDYAHTPDALEKVLLALKPVAQARGGQLWCVFGCGGDRDTTKRPLMAAMAQNNADQIVVTSDNPRSENPAAIISQILLGLTHSESVRVNADRALAIAQAVASAQAGDVLLLAGKGHEGYQEVLGIKQPFDDLDHARLALDVWPFSRAAS